MNDVKLFIRQKLSEDSFIDKLVEYLDNKSEKKNAILNVIIL